MDGKGEWHSTRNNPFESIARGSLTDEAQVGFYFLSSVFLPIKYLNTKRKEEALLMYAILNGYKLNVGKIIEKSILKYYNSNYRGLVPHLDIITRICILRGVRRRRKVFQDFPFNPY